MRSAVFQVFILYFTATEETISGCVSPLGLASGSIKDSQISASTYMSDWQLPSAGRLHNIMSSNSFGAWCSRDTDAEQWFQIDLLTTTKVSAVASQGIDIGMGDGGHWVTRYSLNYSCDGVKWYPYILQGGNEVFNANNDSGSVVTNTLAVPVLARFVRLKPLAWSFLGSICLRLELYGCQINQVCPHPTQDTTLVATTKATIPSTPITKAPTTASDKDQTKSWPLSSGQGSNSQFTDSAVGTTNATPIACSKALGMQSGAISNSQIKASSFKSSWTRPSEGRLHNQLSVQKMSLGGWCAEDSDNNPFLQVDLVNNTIVTALATQGLPGNENSALRYKLNYSCDGKVWFEYQQGKIFQGYRNNRRVRQNKLPVPLKARLVRIHLLSKQYEKACLRLEIYACQKANAVCDNKGLTNGTEDNDDFSTTTSSIRTTSQAKLTETANKRPTKPKDMIVIVNAQGQRPPNNNSAEHNTMEKALTLLTIVILLLNCF